MGGRSVSLACVLAVAAWCVSYALVMAGTIVAFFHLPVGMVLLAHGLLMAAAAAALTVRVFFARQNMLLIEAFRLGREGVDGDVRKMRT